MISKGQILDIKDKINSLEYCLNNSDLNKSVEVDRKELISDLERLSSLLIEETSQMNTQLTRAVDIILKAGHNKDEIEKALKSKMSSFMSTAYKVEMIKIDLMSYESDKIRVSQHVQEFIKNV